MKYLIVDVESTDHSEGGICEIIEFGHAVVEGAEIKSKGGSFIKPNYSRVTWFIEQLTSITNKDLENSPVFEDFFYDYLLDKFDPSEYTFVGWGDYDITIFESMCKLWGIPIPKFAGYMNLKREHAAFYGFKKERGLARALRHANIEFEGFHHRGEDDAYNTAKLFLDLVEKGWV